MIRSINGFLEHVMSFGRNLTPARRDIISYALMGVGVILLIFTIVCARTDSTSPVVCLISALNLGAWLIAFYVSASAVLREEK